MRKKGEMGLPFSWLFAIIAGGIILFLAIFISLKLIGTEQTTQDAKIGKEIGILLNPLETSFESGKITTLTMPSETRIYNKCNNENYFGRQIIQVSQKNFNKWSETEVNIGFSNKYIFSDSYVEGKEFNIFSKPFNFPFKVTDLIYITSSLKEYCFVDAPEEIEEEIEELKPYNIKVKNCSKEEIQVCFNEKNDCDIKVRSVEKSVEKRGEKVYFEEDALMYAAIFSDKTIYECQLKRLMQRIEQLTILYKDKANFISRTGCNSNINPELIQLNNLAKNFVSSTELKIIAELIKDIEDKNNYAQCRIW